jgi:hypothetical protein
MTSMTTIAMFAAIFSRKARSGWMDELDDIRQDALAVPGGEISHAMAVSSGDPGAPGADAEQGFFEEAEADLADHRVPAEQVFNARELGDHGSEPEWPSTPAATLPPAPAPVRPDPDLDPEEPTGDDWWAQPAPHPIRPSEMWHPAITPSSLAPDGEQPREERIESSDLGAGTTGSRRFARFRPKPSVDGMAPSIAPSADPVALSAEPGSPATQDWHGWTDTHIEASPTPTPRTVAPPVVHLAPAAATHAPLVAPPAPADRPAADVSYPTFEPRPAEDDSLWRPPAPAVAQAAPAPPAAEVVAAPAASGNVTAAGFDLDALLAPYDLAETSGAAVEPQPPASGGLLGAPVGRRPRNDGQRPLSNTPLRQNPDAEERSPLPEEPLPPAAFSNSGPSVLDRSTRTGLPAPTRPAAALPEPVAASLAPIPVGAVMAPVAEPVAAPPVPVAEPVAVPAATVAEPVAAVQAPAPVVEPPAAPAPLPAAFVPATIAPDSSGARHLDHATPTGLPTPGPASAEPAYDDPAPTPVRRNRQGELEVVAPIVRLAPEAKASAATGSHGHEVILDEGWCWVAPIPSLGGSAPVAIGCGSTILSLATDANALVVVESDRSLFVLLIAGQANLTYGYESAELNAGSMVMLAPGGTPDIGSASDDEIASDPIVALNRDLDSAH